MKKKVVMTAPFNTRSGYGDHSRDLIRSLIAIDRYDSVCKRRIALAEINNLVDKYESQKRAFTND